MWRKPVSLMSSSSTSLVVTSDTLIGDLWLFLGSPAGPKDITVTVDGADAGNIIINQNWSAGSTFQITVINGGRIIGIGGNGGNGGADLGASGSNGTEGGNGGPALTTNGFTVNLNIDNGFLLGGGGGVGGGAYKNLGSFGDPGSGGGGGQGFGVSTGGVRGANIGLPPGVDGADGSSGGPGQGGVGINNPDTTSGGNGGVFGSGGQAGRNATLVTTASIGQIGGQAGRAFTGDGTLVLSGVKTEVTLRSESRIKGELTGLAINLPSTSAIFEASLGSLTDGFTFQSDGDLLHVKTSGNVLKTTQWLNGTLVAAGANYQIRRILRSGSSDSNGTWDAEPAAVNLWSTLSANRAYSKTSASGIVSVHTLHELRRVDVPLNPDTEIIKTFYLKVEQDHS